MLSTAGWAGSGSVQVPATWNSTGCVPTLTLTRLHRQTHHHVSLSMTQHRIVRRGETRTFASVVSYSQALPACRQC